MKDLEREALFHVVEVVPYLEVVKLAEESHPINVELLMEAHESGRGRDVIHELATQLHALQMTIHELSAELDASASDGGAQSESPHFISRWSRWAGFS